VSTRQERFASMMSATTIARETCFVVLMRACRIRRTLPSCCTCIQVTHQVCRVTQLLLDL
jgi:hypothetical protein